MPPVSPEEQLCTFKFQLFLITPLNYSMSDSPLFNVPLVLHVCASDLTLITVLVTLHLLCDALEATGGQEP